MVLIPLNWLICDPSDGRLTSLPTPVKQHRLVVLDLILTGV